MSKRNQIPYFHKFVLFLFPDSVDNIRCNKHKVVRIAQRSSHSKFICWIWWVHDPKHRIDIFKTENRNPARATLCQFGEEEFSKTKSAFPVLLKTTDILTQSEVTKTPIRRQVVKFNFQNLLFHYYYRSAQWCQSFNETQKCTHAFSCHCNASLNSGTLNSEWTNREWLKPRKTKNSIQNCRSDGDRAENEAKCMQRKLNMMKNHRQNCTQLNKGDITCSDNSNSSGTNKTYKMYATSSGSNCCWWRRFISIAVLIQILANCGKFNCVFPFHFACFYHFANGSLLRCCCCWLVGSSHDDGWCDAVAGSQPPTNIKWNDHKWKMKTKKHSSERGLCSSRRCNRRQIFTFLPFLCRLQHQLPSPPSIQRFHHPHFHNKQPRPQFGEK